MTRYATSTAVVLGAGIQGVAVALALSRAGWRVELIDRAPAPMLRTSLRGEGKIHLGYVYGNEPDRTTAAVMIEGALSFAELLDRWLPRPIDWAALRSSPFVYAILADSMVSADRLRQHYREVDAAIAERFGRGATYVGATTFRVSEQIPSPRRLGFRGDVVAAHQTSEIAVDPGRLRTALITGLDSDAVNWLFDCEVREVNRGHHGLSVTAIRGDGQTITRRADAVINCLWDGRLAVDATMGIPALRPCMYRLKYAVTATMPTPPARCPTTTFALGPFGDVVARADGGVYLSWYPACLAGISTDTEPPSSWRPLVAHPDPCPAGSSIAAATVAHLAQRIPALRDVRIDSVRAGVVVAWGDTDIDQPGSELHQRHAIGVHDHDGYLSVDTGKLTTAPLFARRVVDLLGRATARSA